MRGGWVWWMAVSCLWAGSVLADTPGAGGARDGTPVAGASRGTPPPRAGRDAAEPDDSFLEFLGRDDVEDARWWEFFKQHRPHLRDAAEEPPLREGERS